MTLPPVLEELRRNVVDAAEASWVDTFVVLSATDRHSALVAQELLHPVFMLANVQRVESFVSPATVENICIGATPLLKKACEDTRQTTKLAHGRLQLWWVARCLMAVQSYEQLAASSYDFVVKVRPDVVYLKPLPPLRSLDPNYVHFVRKNNNELFDVIFVVPRRHKEGFLRAITQTMTSPQVAGNMACCPESTLDRSLQQLTSIGRHLLDIPVGIRRACSLECSFPIAGSPPADTSCSTGPRTEYEQLCHKAAARGNVFGITKRIQCMWRDHGFTQPCYGWNSGMGSFRASCCEQELRRSCEATQATVKHLGWPASCAPNGTSSRHQDGADDPTLAAAKALGRAAVRGQFHVQDKLTA
jgi:hypothetical protein